MEKVNKTQWERQNPEEVGKQMTGSVSWISVTKITSKGSSSNVGFDALVSPFCDFQQSI